jgi:6-pyruvoyltetrahydropterin/6-carboxytetrahydropterin synthase
VAKPEVTVTRRLHFSAAHRVHNPAMSDDENRRTYGKCNNPNWHGHNYILDVSVRGAVDDHTGYVMDLGRVRDVVQKLVIEKVDHRNLNLEVDFLKDVIPTTENIVVAFWRVLAPALAPAKLTRLILWETVNNYVEYDGR